MERQFWWSDSKELDRGRKDINYGPGIVIAVATDVTQTKVSMHLNDDDFSGYIFHNFLGLSKARKQERYVRGGKEKVYPGFCPVGPLDVCNSFVGPGKRYADPLKLITLVTDF